MNDRLPDIENAGVELGQHAREGIGDTGPVMTRDVNQEYPRLPTNCASFPSLSGLYWWPRRRRVRG